MGKSKAARLRNARSPAPKKAVIGLTLLIIVAGILVYAGSFQGPFLFDDVGHIVQNESIRSLWPEWTDRTLRRPVVTLTLALNYAVSGLEGWSYHVFNVAVHILAALTLFGVIRRTLHRRQTETYAGPRANWLAALMALIWVVHPLQTQSVSYIVQRGESLMGLFYLLTVYGVIRGVQSPRRAWWYAAAVIACGLGMASKAVMVTAPVVVLLYDMVFVSASFGEPFRKRWGLYLGLAATWGVLFACNIVQTVLSPANVGTVGLGYKEITSSQYLMTQAGVLVWYLKLALWPSHLCLDYDWPVASNLATMLPQAILVVLLLGGSVWALIRRPWLGFLGAWFFLILAPTSSFIPIKDPVFEHRMYLPLAAVIGVMVVGVDWLLRVWERRSPGQAALLQVGRIGLVILAVGALGWRTVERNRDYRSRVAMWESVVAQQPQSARAYCNLGVALSEEAGRLEEAIRACRKSVELDPNFASGHFRLGQILDKTGAFSEAVPAFRNAIRLDPKDTDAYYSLGNALFQLGRFEEAAEQYRRALAVDPAYVSARVNLGNTLRMLGKSDEAITAYREAVETLPDFTDARFNLGVALAERGVLDEAVVAFRMTIQYDPAHAPAHRALGNALYAQGKVDEAIAVYRTARRLDPNHPAVHFNLGNALMDKQEYDEAIKSYQEVLRLRPGLPAVQQAIEDALERKNRS